MIKAYNKLRDNLLKDDNDHSDTTYLLNKVVSRPAGFGMSAKDNLNPLIWSSL